MKYVMLRQADGVLFAVMGLGMKVTHSGLAAAFPAHAVVGAGFVAFNERGGVETFGHSASLHIGPHPDDARMLSTLYRVGLPAAPSPLIRRSDSDNISSSSAA